MTSHTTKQEARAYQRAHGVPYAEARRRVMNGDADGPPPQQNQAAPSWGVARGLAVGFAPETEKGVMWVRRGRSALPRRTGGSAVPPPTLGVFGPTNSGRTSLVRSLVQQASPAPTLILCTEDTRRSEYTGLRTASSIEPRDLFSTDGTVNAPALEAATDGVALVVLDLSDTLMAYALLAALHSSSGRAAAVAFTHPVYGPCDAPWPDPTGVDLIGMVSDAPKALDFCSSLVVLTGKGRGYLGRQADGADTLEPFTNTPASPDIQFSLQPATGPHENPGQVLTMYLEGDRLDSVALPEYGGRGSSIPDTVLMAQSDRAAVSLALRNGYDVDMPEWMV